jgi:hypothetical protein
MKQISSKTAIKCNFSNEVHKVLEPNINIKRTDRWKHKKNELSDKQKLELFEKIVALHNQCSRSIVSINTKKQLKKEVEKDRVARGVTKKKKVNLKLHLNGELA